jgi:hypothetical protein
VRKVNAKRQDLAVPTRKSVPVTAVGLLQRGSKDALSDETVMNLVCALNAADCAAVPLYRNRLLASTARTRCQGRLTAAAS